MGQRGSDCCSNTKECRNGFKFLEHGVLEEGEKIDLFIDSLKLAGGGYKYRDINTPPKSCISPGTLYVQKIGISGGGFFIGELLYFYLAYDYFPF